MLIMRSTLLDVLSEDYILTAKAKGLSTFQILKDHALKNAMLPMVTIIALNLGFTVSGAIQIETVFSWPGLGGAIFTAVGRRDYPVLQGAFLLIAVSVIFANLVADLLYSGPRSADPGGLNSAMEGLRNRDGFRRSLARNQMGMAGLIMIVLVTIMAVFAPLLAPYDPYEVTRVTIDDIYAPPSLEHPLGTDDAGKDVLSSFMYGARVSLIVGFFASLISIAIGGVIGISAGFFGGRVGKHPDALYRHHARHPRIPADYPAGRPDRAQLVEHHPGHRPAGLDGHRRAWCARRRCRSSSANTCCARGPSAPATGISSATTSFPWSCR